MKRVLFSGLVRLVGLNIALLVKLILITKLFSGTVAFYDFDNYYRAVQGIFKELNPYVQKGWQPWGPPLTLVFFLPFAWLSLAAARFWFTVVNLLAGYGTAWLLARYFFPRARKTAFLSGSLILMGSFVSRHSLLMGQPSLLLGFLLSLVLTTSRAWVQGMALGGLVVGKSFFGGMLLSRLRKARLSLVVAVFTVGGVIGITSFWLKPGLYTYYLRERLGAVMGGWERMVGLDYYNQSLGASLYRLGLGNWYGVLWVVLLLMGVYFIWKYQDLTLAAFVSLLVSPVIWQYYLVFAFPLMIEMVAKITRRSIGWLLVGFLLWFAHFPWLHQAQPTVLTALLASHFWISIFCFTIARLFWLEEQSSKFQTSKR